MNVDMVVVKIGVQMVTRPDLTGGQPDQFHSRCGDLYWPPGNNFKYSSFIVDPPFATLARQ